MNENGTGIEYPTLKLGEIVYTLKFTRGTLLFRLSKAGVKLPDRMNPDRSVAATVETLAMVMQPQFVGTHEELTDLILDEDKMREASIALNIALGKVFPPTQVAAGTAGEIKTPLQ
jgi:hypothetical protein